MKRFGLQARGSSWSRMAMVIDRIQPLAPADEYTNVQSRAFTPKPVLAPDDLSMNLAERVELALAQEQSSPQSDARDGRTGSRGTSSFYTVSREQLDRRNRSDTPPLGTYFPKFHFVLAKSPRIIFRRAKQRPERIDTEGEVCNKRNCSLASTERTPRFKGVPFGKQTERPSFVDPKGGPNEKRFVGLKDVGTGTKRVHSFASYSPRKELFRLPTYAPDYTPKYSFLSRRRRIRSTVASNNQMMHHSSRVHLTRDSVYAHVCKEDVQQASKPLTRFSSTEYLRALNSQVQRFDDAYTEVPEKTLYLIDKMVRLRTKETKFGFDHSEVLNLERELLEPFVKGTNTLKTDRGDLNESQFSKKLMEKLSYTVSGVATPDQGFEEWKRKKEAEMRLKTKLIEEAIQEEVQKRIDQEEEHQRKLEESQRKTEEWEHQKKLEAQLRRHEDEQRRLELEAAAEQKKHKAEGQFKLWLKDNFLKLREAKHQEAVAKKAEELKAVERQRQEEERRWQCEQQFQQWLRRKNAEMSRSTNSVTSKPGKTKKPIMLAYSPNRKLKMSSSPSDSQDPSKYAGSEIDLVRDLSSAEEMKSSRSSTSSKPTKKPKKPVKKMRAKRTDDVQPIEELSSIQRTSHQGGHFASGEEDVEGFIYSGNEDESSER